MTLDALMLARIQFAANISFHILFPSITIALGWILLFFKWRFSRTGDVKWMEAYFFYTKIFALCFALGVVSGITMSFQFGTNWPGFMQTVGNIAGPLLAYEVLTAFFLEATFLGIMLFGFRRVPPWVHTLATFLVAFGTTLSAFWILVLNSWMHTPAGYEIRDGVVVATDWLAIIFNPSMPYRLGHMMLASGITAAFLVAGIAAYRRLRNDRSESVLAALKSGVYLAAILLPAQILLGDLHGLNTRHHQPAKIAAIEAIWKTQSGVPLVLFAHPNATTQRNDNAIEIPKLASLILAHDPNATLQGLDAFPGRHPPVAPVFWAFRIMVAMGLLMLACAWIASYQLQRQRTLSPLMLRSLIVMTFSGWIACLAGWYATEIGRQPWLVTGLLLTEQAASQVASSKIGLCLSLYLSLYVGLLLAFVSTLFYMARQSGDPVHLEKNP